MVLNSCKWFQVVLTCFKFDPYPRISNTSSNSFIPSWDIGFFKVSFNSFKSFIFKKFNICAAWLSDNSAPLVIAPLSSFLSFLSKSSTPFRPNPGLSSLSIARMTLVCFFSGRNRMSDVMRVAQTTCLTYGGHTQVLAEAGSPRQPTQTCLKTLRITRFRAQCQPCLQTLLYLNPPYRRMRCFFVTQGPN